MFKLILLLVAALLVVSPAAGKPQVLVDYGYYSAPAYVATYGTPLAYSYPYAYAYGYPWGYY